MSGVTYKNRYFNYVYCMNFQCLFFPLRGKMSFERSCAPQPAATRTSASIKTRMKLQITYDVATQRHTAGVVQDLRTNTAYSQYSATTRYPKCHIASASDAHTDTRSFGLIYLQYVYITQYKLSRPINGPDRNYFPTASFLFHFFQFSFSPSHSHSSLLLLLSLFLRGSQITPLLK